MRGGALKYKPLIFKRKNLRSRRRDCHVFEMNQDSVRSEENGRCQREREKRRNCMRQWFADGHVGHEVIVAT